MPNFSKEWYEEYQRTHPATKAGETVREAQSSEPECPVRNAPVGKAQGKDSHPPRFAVRITSRRKRLIDPDNLCAKYFVDGLRYCGFIPNDSARDIEYSIRQEKVKAGEETTVIEIEPLP